MNNTKYFFLVSLVTLFCASCAKEVNRTAANGPTITATLADSDAKTALVDGGTKVYWEAGDELSVFYNDALLRFVSLNKKQTETAVFACTQNVVIAFSEDESSSPLIGLYPYDENAECDGQYVTTTLPSEQVGRAGSFGTGYNITMAKSNSTSLAFFNVLGGLRFSLSSAGIKTITLEGNNAEAVAGTFTANFDGEKPAVSSVVTAKDKIIFTAPSGGTFETGKWYYIVTLPGTLSGGIKMHFETEDKFADLVSTKSLTFERGKFGSVQNIDKNLEFQDLATKADWIVTGDGDVSKIADDDLTTYWVAPSTTLPVSLTIDMKIKRNIDRFYFNQAWNHQNGTCFSKYKLEYSTDNTNWSTAVAERAAGTSDPYTQGIMFDGNQLVSARYFRLTFTESADNTKPVQLAEFNVGNSTYTSGATLWMPSLKNNLDPFAYGGYDPMGWGRWYQISDWTHENSNMATYDTGSYYTPSGGSPVLFAWEHINVNNAKLFQTLYLMPGVYTFGVAAKKADNAQWITAYMAGSKGNTLTDFSVLSSGTPGTDANYLNSLILDSSAMPTGSEEHHWNWMYLPVNEAGNVSMGFVYATSIPSGQTYPYTQLFWVGANLYYSAFIQ